MILVNLCRSIKKSNFNKNITQNSLSIYKYQVFSHAAPSRVSHHLCP